MDTKDQLLDLPNVRSVDFNEIDDLLVLFWKKFSPEWDEIYAKLMSKNRESIDKMFCYVCDMLGNLHKYIALEFTIGCINNISYSSSENQVELYVSPLLLKSNEKIMNKFINLAPPLSNLTIVKYKCFNIKDDIIKTISSNDVLYSISDFRYQVHSAQDESKKLMYNLVITVPDTVAKTLLAKKKIQYIDKQQKTNIIEKWLPTNTDVIPTLLTNLIGEYNMIHKIGYIEFLPESDPLYDSRSEFLQMESLRNLINTCVKFDMTSTCNLCGRMSYQKNIYKCSACMKTKYCTKLCQVLDFSTHKLFCNNNI
jgi:hypothetical protein